MWLTELKSWAGRVCTSEHPLAIMMPKKNVFLMQLLKSNGNELLTTLTTREWMNYAKKSSYSCEPYAMHFDDVIKTKNNNFKNILFICTNPNPNPSYLFFHLLFSAFVSLIYILVELGLRSSFYSFERREPISYCGRAPFFLSLVATTRLLLSKSL